MDVIYPQGLLPVIGILFLALILYVTIGIVLVEEPMKKAKQKIPTTSS